MPPLLSEQHPISRRWAIVDDEAVHSVWLYLTEPDSMRPARDAFLCSRIAPITREQVATYRNGPPPVCVGFLDPSGIITDQHLDLALRWSRDGESVCVLLNKQPSAFASSRLPRGTSRTLLRSGPWGEPWNDDLYTTEFAK